jgi:hypothetical protein
MEDSQSTLSEIPPQHISDDLEMYNLPPRRRSIGFLHLPYELRCMIDHYLIPRNYEVYPQDSLVRTAVSNIHSTTSSAS